MYDIKHTSNVDQVGAKQLLVEANNVMRHEYKALSDAEKEQVTKIKDMGRDFFEYLTSIDRVHPHIFIAKTKVEEAVMWSVKYITG